MKKAENLVAKKGFKAKNWFIHTPVCCPSRAELYSGRYFHNVRESSPKGGCMHADLQHKVLGVSYHLHLQQAGYTNGYFGKHANSCPQKPPPGFDGPTDYWFANGGGSDHEPGGYLNASFHDYSRLPDSGTVNGTYQANTNGEYAGYTTSIIANKSIEWVKRVAKLGKPFHVTVAAKAPHVPSTPASWYAKGTFIDALKAPRTPDYNASKEQLKDHHWLIAQQGPITEKQGAQIDELFRNRWRCLLSVDDAVAGMIATLEELDVMNNTYIFITSDHGFNLGQHRLPSCKLNVYDHDIRIPMVASGPGIKPNTEFALPASNVDVGPTFLGLAGLEAPEMDGRSVVPLIVNEGDEAVSAATRAHIERARAAASGWRDHHFVEYYSLGDVKRYGHLVDDSESNTYRALRFVGSRDYGDLLYSEFTAVSDWNFSNVSFYELFNMTTDPHQLHNLYTHAPETTKRALHEQVVKQWTCAGRDGGANPCP